MDDIIIDIEPESVEIISETEYCDDITKCFVDIPNIAYSLVKNAKKCFSKIEQMLYTSPSFINMVKASIPEQTFKAILTNEQKEKLANGTLKLMTKKDGTLMANLVNPKTKKIVSTISLQSVDLAPELSQAMTSYASQMQLAQIAEEIQQVQNAIEDVRQGQEYDRLATAYSCQQKLFQAMEIKSPELKSMALIRIALDAEDSRNLLMQSQNANLTFIKEQPDSFFGKLISGASNDKINQRMEEIRESLNAVNLVSLVEAMAYQEMGESSAAKKSLQYYAEYIDKSYISIDGFVDRLDLIDPSPENYWSKTLPSIKDKIEALPFIEEIPLLKEEI